MPVPSRYSIENKSGVAVIQIIGDIDWWDNDSKSFTARIDEFIKAGITDVEGYINSPGGDMFEGNEIGNQIRRFTGNRTAKLGALVASSATTVSMAFKKVVAAKNTQFMIHDPSWRPVIQHTEDFESSKQLYENLRNQAIEEYVEKTGISKEEVSEMMRKTTWMNASTALEKGFVDEVSDENSPMPDNAFEALNKMKFNVPKEVLLQMKAETNLERNMNKVLKHLGLPENATEEQVIEAIKAKDNAAVNALVAFGKTKGFKEDTLKNLAANDATTTLKMIEEQNVVTPPANGAGDNGGEGGDGTPANPKNGGEPINQLLNALQESLKGGNPVENKKKWDDYSEAELEAIQDKTPDVFDQLYNEKFKK